MSLLGDIRDAAVDGRIPISTLLRKCAVLAARLTNDDFKTWVNCELNGYPETVPLPEYRTLPAYASGHLVGPLGSGYRNITIPEMVMPAGFEDFARCVHLRQAISALEAVAVEPETEGDLSFPWPGELVALVQREGRLNRRLVLYGAWQKVARAQFVGLIDTVRNRVLEFILQMEKDAPDAGESVAPSRASNEVAQQFITHIYGNVGNVANASQGAVQTTTQVAQGDTATLLAGLKGLGIPENEVHQLATVLREEPQKGSIGPKTSGWMSKATEAISSGTWKVGTGVTAQAVVKLLTSYLGLG